MTDQVVYIKASFLKYEISCLKYKDDTSVLTSHPIDLDNDMKVKLDFNNFSVNL